jgi:hypothetical protein
VGLLCGWTLERQEELEVDDHLSRRLTKLPSAKRMTATVTDSGRPCCIRFLLPRATCSDLPIVLASIMPPLKAQRIRG